MSVLVSVIMCTHNRQESLAKTLESLLCQKVNRDFDYEVLLVDNNSVDNTKGVIGEYATKFSGKLKYLSEPVPGKAYAVNRGIKEAKGEILVFTDDDVVVDSEWLCFIVQCFLSYPCDAVAGRVLPVYPEKTPEWVKQNAVKMAGGVVIYDMGQETKPFDDSTERFIGANFAFRKEIFQECGLFRLDLGPGQGVVGEDTEFFYRLRKKNKKIYYCGKALVWHPVDLERLTFKHMAIWHIALGRFSARMEFEDKTKEFVYCLGIPRYLIKGVVRDGFSLIINMFDRMSFHDAYRSFFRKIGMIKEYRAMMQKTSGVNRAQN